MKIWDVIKELHHNGDKSFKSGKYFLEKSHSTGIIECFWIGTSGIKRMYNPLHERNLDKDWEEVIS